MPNEYDIENGQIYIACDGSKCGHLVTDVDTYAKSGQVVTTPFTVNGFMAPGNLIEAFKLAMVRYYLVDSPPDWMPGGKL